ncbi:hypothetical protein A6F49_04640 [Enteractinococcus helveticum]|uniref:Uncharacterized protein n=1 Tax=Enteractinococcus helveticum TaxID=1837282 RepID=A0A1B7M2H1_9MICC|nr:hypothetical protein A6F49_04640 [Enteractinococcus helveticum]
MCCHVAEKLYFRTNKPIQRWQGMFFDLANGNILLPFVVFGLEITEKHEHSWRRASHQRDRKPPDSGIFAATA